jgi:hypothetical protein
VGEDDVAAIWEARRPTFVPAAQNEEAEISSRTCYLRAGALEVPVRDESVDLVVAFMSLMDMSDPSRASGRRE